MKGFRFNDRRTQSKNDQKEITKLDVRKIGKVIATYRKEKGYTQTELAEKLGVSFQAVSNWERGDTMPDLDNLLALSTALETSLDVLLGREQSAKVKAEPESVDIEAIKAQAIKEYIESNKPHVDFDGVFSNRNRYSQQQIDSTAIEYIKQTGDIVKIREKFSLISYPALKEITRIRYEQTGDAIEAACFIGPLLSTLDGIKMAGDLKALGADDEDVASVINGRAWREKYVLQNYDAQTVTDIIKNRRYSQRDIDDIAISYVEKTMDVATVRSLLMLITNPALHEITRVIYQKTGDAIEAAGFIGPYLDYNDKQKMIADLKALGADDVKINDVLSGKVWRSKHPAVLCDAASLVKILTQERHMHTQLDMDELAIAYLDNTMDVKTIRSVLMQISNPALYEITRIIYEKTGDAVEAASFIGPYLNHGPQGWNKLKYDLKELGIDNAVIANCLNGNEWSRRTSNRSSSDNNDEDFDLDEGELGDKDVEAIEFIANGGRLCELTGFAPFISTKVLDKLVVNKIRQGAPVADAVAFAPFISSKAVDTILKEKCYHGARIADMTAFAPFASQDTISWVIAYKTDMGARIADMVAFAPFMNQSDIDSLIKKKSYQGARLSDMQGFAPFMSKETADWLFQYKSSQGASLRDIIAAKYASGDDRDINELVLEASANGANLAEVVCFKDQLSNETIKQCAMNSLSRGAGAYKIIVNAHFAFSQEEIDNIAIEHTNDRKSFVQIKDVYDKISLPALKQIAKNYYSKANDITNAAAFIYPMLDETERAKLIEDVSAIDPSAVSSIKDGSAWEMCKNEYQRYSGNNNYQFGNNSSSGRRSNRGNLSIDDILKLGGILDEDEIYEIVCDRLGEVTVHDLIMLKEVLNEDQLNEIVLDNLSGELEVDEIIDLINEGVIYEDTAFELAEDMTPLSIDDLVSLSTYIDDDEVAELAMESDLDIDEVLMLRGLIDDDCIREIAQECCEINIDTVIKLASIIDQDVLADLISDNSENFSIEDIAKLKGVIDDDVLKDIAEDII